MFSSHPYLLKICYKLLKFFEVVKVFVKLFQKLEIKIICECVLQNFVQIKNQNHSVNVCVKILHKLEIKIILYMCVRILYKLEIKIILDMCV